MAFSYSKKHKDNYHTLPPETVLGWIEGVTKIKIPNKKDVQGALKDGVTLCTLINKIKPGAVKKINKNKLPYMQMDNISQFIRHSKQLGVKEQDCMSAVDLFDGSNIPQVLLCLEALGRVCRTIKTFKGPFIGVSESKKNTRDQSKFSGKKAPALGLLDKKKQDIEKKNKNNAWD